ncbi:CDP-glucose 4,6-dehydratase [Candidatus Levibacter sp. Uisw_134_01]|uniref:CDP-glucose 4,6-dehydratase n=1 Tax=Candidatus Levibacter sp. Uisw_134_01 TaxID=3230999 RepID=UPI003D5D0865
MKQAFWKNRSVFLSGHTGFKGGWLALWLSELGAKVHGYSLEMPSNPNFFSEIKLEDRIESSTIGDIRDLDKLISSMYSSKASVVIHMAAQSLVRESYNSPLETFTTNIIGTVNILEAVRKAETVEAIVNITTDKCYDNKEWFWPYRENDSLGGHDPYSSSKACAELISSSYRKSFLMESGTHLASVRAGNVIGGGDWGKDRLIPDLFRAIDTGKTLRIRSPNSVRPWQHVLEPLSGYLMLAEKLILNGEQFAEAWNFGPLESDTKAVSWIVEHLCKNIPKSVWVVDDSIKLHEAGFLKLDSTKAKTKLGWKPRWPLEIALAKTLDWHQSWKKNQSMAEISIEQIKAYEKL